MRIEELIKEKRVIDEKEEDQRILSHLQDMHHCESVPDVKENSEQTWARREKTPRQKMNPGRGKEEDEQVGRYDWNDRVGARQPQNAVDQEEISRLCGVNPVRLDNVFQVSGMTTLQICFGNATVCNREPDSVIIPNSLKVGSIKVGEKGNEQHDDQHGPMAGAQLVDPNARRVLPVLCR